MMVLLADTLSAEASQSVRHKQLISSYCRHLLLRSAAWSSKLGEKEYKERHWANRMEAKGFLPILNTEA